MNFLNNLKNWNNTFRPVKNFQQGTLRYDLHKVVQNSLAECHTTALMFQAIKVPAHVDFNEWASVHVIEFYNKLSALYATICDECEKNGTNLCSKMCAGTNYLYLWRDAKKYKKPTEMSAHQYITLSMDYIDEVMSDEKLFPPAELGKYPKTFKKTTKELMKKMFRIFAHIMYTHFATIQQAQQEAQLNLYFKQFICFALEYRLLKESELEPMKEWIASHLHVDVHKYLKKRKAEMAQEQAASPASAAAVNNTPTTATNTNTASNHAPIDRRQSVIHVMKTNSDNQVNSPMNQASLTVEVIEAKQLAAKDLLGTSDPFVEIAFEDAVYTTSTMYKTLNPEWKETFSFIVKSNSAPLTVSVFDYNLIRAKNLIGYCTFDLNEFTDETVHDVWVDLVHPKQQQVYLGQLHLKIYYTSSESGQMEYLKTITNTDYYAPLLQLVHETAVEHLLPLFDLNQITYNDKIWKSLLYITLSNQNIKKMQYLELVQWAIELEVVNCPRFPVLFRNNTVASKLVATYMNTLGQSYLQAVLGPWVTQVCKQDAYLEVDPARYNAKDAHAANAALHSLDTLQACEYNMKVLLKLVSELVLHMAQSFELVPMDLRVLMKRLVEHVQVKFDCQNVSNGASMVYSAVGGFWFLRFVNPALINPHLQQHHLTHLVPKSNAKRTLTLACKLIQQLANDEVAFGAKETFMLAANPFLQQHRDVMHQFLDTISTVDSSLELQLAVDKQQDNFYKDEKQYQERMLWALFHVHSCLYNNADALNKVQFDKPQCTHFPMSAQVAQEMPKVLNQYLETVTKSVGEPPQMSLISSASLLKVSASSKHMKKK